MYSIPFAALLVWVFWLDKLVIKCADHPAQLPLHAGGHAATRIAAPAASGLGSGHDQKEWYGTPNKQFKGGFGWRAMCHRPFGAETSAY